MIKLVVQNSLNPMDKRVVENVKGVDFPQNFQPFHELKLKNVIYLYYDKSFQVIRIKNSDYYSIHPK